MTVFKHIINLFLKNDYPQDTRKRFWLWLADPIHEDLKDQELKSVWDSLDAEVTQSTIDSLRIVEQKLSFNKKESTRKSSLIIRLAKIAAVLLLPIFSALLTYTYLFPTETPITLIECFAPDKEQKKITLSDGSIVTLNSGSIIIYPEEQNGQQRYVYLNGEAYFDVSHNPDIPFIVKTGDIEVEVLGTKFNISAYSDEPDITTILETGKVRLNFKNGDMESVELSPNDKIIYNKTTRLITRSTVSDAHIAVWREGQLLFTDVDLSHILRAFEHKYGITVFLNSDKYQDAVLTVKFIHGETLEESLEILKKIIPGFRYELEKDKLFIY